MTGRSTMALVTTTKEWEGAQKNGTAKLFWSYGSMALLFAHTSSAGEGSISATKRLLEHVNTYLCTCVYTVRRAVPKPVPVQLHA